MVRDDVWKYVFLTHLCSQKGPFSRQFGTFGGPKRVTCLSIPSGLGKTLDKIIFSAAGTMVDPPLAPTVRGLRCPLYPPSDHPYGGLGISLGDSEDWKPQNMGGCGWTRRPRNSVLSHVAQDGLFDTNGAQSGPFLAILGPFLGHIVESEGKKGLFVTGQSWRM